MRRFYIMKNNITYIASLLLGGMIGFSSCTDSFESYNTNEAGFNNESKKQDFNYYTIPLSIVQQGVYFNYDWGSGKNWTFQTMQNLGSDLFAGYVHDFNPFNDGKNNSTYYMMDGWNGSSWDNTYGYIMPEVQKSEQINENINWGFYGITKILKVELMHRISDLYGPIVYTQFGSKTGSKPDTQQEAYTAFFKDLDEGIDKIRKFVADNPGMENFTSFDVFMPEGKKNYAQWIKFANSLRLRLAVRLSVVAPKTAAAEIEKAMNPDAGGLLEANNDIVAVSTALGFTNPFGEINKGWGEVFLNANLESYMKGYEDPRLEKYFEKAEGVKDETSVIAYAGTYKGIRPGTGFSHKNYAKHSKSTISQTTSAVLMTPAEIWFLRAEAALREFTTEDPKDCYEKGVRASFAQWGADGADKFLASDNVPADYKDAFNAEYNVKAAGTITPKWDEGAGPAVKLERIITQKWLAMFPEGCEAWTEQRRTGFPKLFEVMVNQSGGTVDSKIGPRRLNFFVSIKTTNPEQYQQLLDALGGADNCGTRLWWDTGRNF